MQKLILVLCMLLLPPSLWANARVQGECAQGGKVLITNGTVPVLVQSYVNLVNNVPVSGCAVSVYVAGTTTLAVLSTNTQATTANPFLADSSGHWYFEVANGFYDVTLAGAGIALPFTFGSISAWDSRTAGLVDISQYGAVPDGTDHTTEFTAAIAAMSLGGTLLLTPGTAGQSTYLVTSLTTTRNITIQCTSPNIVLQTKTNNVSLITFSGVTGGGIRGCTLDTNYNTHTGATAVAATNSTNLVFDSNRFQNVGAVAIGLTKVQNIEITHNTFNNIGKSSVRLEDPGTGNTNQNIWVRNNVFSNGNVTVTTGSGAIAVVPSASNGIQQNMWFEDNSITTPGTTGIEANQISYGHFNHNTIVGNTTAGECIAFVGAHNQVSRNNTSRCGSSGIMLYGVNDEGSMDWNTIEDNTVWDNKNQGISFVFGKDSTAINHLQIRGNRVFDSGLGVQNWGIQDFCNSMTGSCVIGGFDNVTFKDSIIRDNDLSYNVLGAVNFATLTIPSSNITYELNITQPGGLDLIGPISVVTNVLDPKSYLLNTTADGTGAQRSGINFVSNNQPGATIGFDGPNNVLPIVSPRAQSEITFQIATQATAISITSISAANPAVLVVASVPAGLTTNKFIYLSGLPGTGCAKLYATPQLVTNIAGTSLTVAGTGVGCTYAGGGTFTTTTLTGYVDIRGWSPPAISFANLTAANLPFFVWCPDCTIATPCTGAGTGAYGFRNSNTGVWKCPF